MNIFALSISPRQSAQYHGDKHVVKMILESCQMLYSAHWFHDPSGKSIESAPRRLSGDRGYKPAHMNHPCTKWVRATLGNYMWTVRLTLALIDEYEYRWPGRVHACKEHALWLKTPPPLTDTRILAFAVAMDDEYKVEGDPVASYRKYYIQSKSVRGLDVYTKRKRPGFLGQKSMSKPSFA